MASMLSGAMAAVGQARTDATAALERGVERAKAAATDAVEHARGSVVSLSTTAPTPCAVCGRPTRSGDGGACGDVGDMAGKEPKEGPRRCYSCLTAAENEQVEATRKQQHETLDSFFAGEPPPVHVDPEETSWGCLAVHKRTVPPPVHVDPEETSLEKAHRLGSLALGGAVDLMGWIPGVGSITKGTIQVLHKVVKFGPLALYSAELVETLQLLVVMANRTGAAKVAEEEAESGTGKAPTGRALEVSEMSVGFYYLLLEHRNAAAVDPERVLREHQRCSKVEAAVLDDLADCLPLGCNVAYASNPAEAQRQLRLLGNWELVLREGQGPGGQPFFTVAADRRAKRVAVLIPGTQTPQDCVTDLKALPVKVLADGSLIGWVHRGMMRQASTIIRLVGSALERFEKDGYEVLFIGHSLGAGVSAIAGAVARLGIEKVKLKKVRSFCYATPAIGNGSFGKYCEGHAITVINCEDIVPRLSLETARKLREELSTRREAVRLFVSEDIAALKDVNNITEKKTRSKSASLKAMEVKQGEEAAEELANLGIPAPLPGTSAKVAAEVAKKEKKSKPGFLCCTTAQEDSEEENHEAQDLLEPDDTDPASIRLVPPGRLIHLARYSGARRACWVQRSHPVLHRIQVHHGIGQDHSGDSYREGLQEALLAANGILPKPWAPVDQAATCSCCSTDFVWSTVLRSEPHRLAARCRCHSCGDVVCDGCSQRKLPLPHVGILREVRVCDRCFLKPKTVTR